jgi:hypothetical protein
MASDPEAQAQLARLLRDDSLRVATEESVAKAVDDGFDVLVEGIVAEAAASDDVLDQETAAGFVRLRIESLKGVLTGGQSARLKAAVLDKIASW